MCRTHFAPVAAVLLFFCSLQAGAALNPPHSPPPELVLLGGHVQSFSSLALSPDGKLLAATDGRNDHIVRVWDLATGDLRTILRGHTDPVLASAFSPDGNWLATGGNDGTARLWEVATGKTLHMLGGHEGDIRLAFSPDGQTLVTGSGRDEVKVWDPATGTQRSTLKGVWVDLRGLAFSPDGKLLAAASDLNATVWNASTGVQLLKMRCLQTCFAVAFSPDSRWAAWVTYKGEVHFFDAQGGGATTVKLPAETPLYTIAFSHDGRWFATGGAGGAVHIWDAATRAPLRTLVGHAGDVTAVTFCPGDGCLISAAKDGSVRLWETGTGEALAVMTAAQTTEDWAISTPSGLFDGTANGAASLMAWRFGAENYPLDRLPAEYKYPGLLAKLVAEVRPAPRIAASSLGTPPSVRITAPENGAAGNATQVAVTLAVEDTGGGIGEVRLLVNGKPLPRPGAARPQRVPPPASGPSRSFSVTLTPGENELAAAAASRQGFWSNPDHIRVYLETRAAAVPESKPELVLQTGHAQGFDGGVLASVFSPDQAMLATASEDRTIRLWDVNRGRELRAFTGHRMAVTSIAFSPDGRRLVSAGRDRTVRVWDVDSGRELLTYRGFRASWVTTVAFSPDGRRIAAAGEDLDIHVVDATTGREVRRLRGHTPDKLLKDKANISGVVFSPDSRLLASFARDQTARIWDIAAGRELHALQGHQGGVASVAFAPDGSRVLTGGADGLVKVWDVKTGAERMNWKAHEQGVNALHPGSDGRTLTTLGRDQALRVWELASGREFRSLPEREGALSPDGRWLAAGPHVREVESGTWVFRFAGVTRPVKSITFSGDSRWLVIHHAEVWGSKAATGLWELPAGLELRSLDVGSAELMRFTPDGRWLVTAGRFLNGASLVSPESGLPLSRRDTASKPAYFIAASPNARWLASVAEDLATRKKSITIWDATTQAELRTFPVDDGLYFYSASLSPDAKWLALQGKARINIWDTERRQIAASFQTNTFEREVVFSPSAPLVAENATAGIGLWDITTRKLAHYLRHNSRDATTYWTFSPDGKWLACEGLGDTVLLWEVASGRLAHNLAGHTYQVQWLAFSPDSRLLVSAGRDATVHVWDVATGRKLHVLRGHSLDVQTLAFSHDGRWLASGSVDGSVRIWDMESGENAANIVSLQDGWVVVTPDGLFDGVPAALGRLLWRFGGRTREVAPLELFFNEFYYPGLLADILAGKRPRAAKDIAQVDRRQPAVRLTLPGRPAGAVVSERRVMLNIEVQEAKDGGAGSGARDLRLFRNGALVQAWRGNLLTEGKGSVTVTADVSIVAGENRFTAYAFNRDNIKSSDAEMVVTGADGLRRKGTAYILAIGIDRYAGSDYNLRFAGADASLFAAEVQKQLTALASFAKVEVVLLQDEQATKANILEALRRFAPETASPTERSAPAALERIRPAAPEDALFVFYAGHGTAVGPRFYLIPHDLGYTGKRLEIDEAGLQTVLRHSVSDRELERAFEPIDAGRIVLVIDACNSGQALEAEEKRRGPMNSKGLAQLAYEKGMYILTAAQGYQAALEVAQLGHGYLTYALVEEGLKTPAADGSPKDGQIAVREWLDYPAQRVPQMQASMMQEAQKMGRSVAFVEGEEAVADPARRSLQRPRAFYRREPESTPLVVGTVSGR